MENELPLLDLVEASIARDLSCPCAVVGAFVISLPPNPAAAFNRLWPVGVLGLTGICCAGLGDGDGICFVPRHALPDLSLTTCRLQAC